MWVRVRDAIAGALDSMTLADLVPQLIRQTAAGLPILPSRPAPAVTAAD
jgi:DNA-binding IscR family transcriptional regulator